jgi:hypothetical protein
MFRLNRNRSMQQEARRAPFFCLTATQQRGILSSRERESSVFRTGVVQYRRGRIAQQVRARS